MKNSIKYLCIVSSLSLLISCATVTSGNKQKIKIRAIDTESNQIINDIKCNIKSQNNEDLEIMTPAELEISRGSEDLMITCKKIGFKNGFKKVSSVFSENFDKGVNNNITIIGGPIDILSGAAYSYPQQITILIEKS